MHAHLPERVLIVYGTLAPNKSNHSVVENIKGTWHKGKVRGKLVDKGWGAQTGHNGYTPANLEEQTEIEVFVLISNELIDNWQRLDNFEGDDYKRILAKYELETGEKGVGYIYAVHENNL
ncbi:MAG: gamma-glutamylcyclotransferase [Cyclobacteriaceae bacterium]|nr:gamma-glutamylcyclotransferase [Cyclobacteriaceae bacterium]